MNKKIFYYTLSGICFLCMITSYENMSAILGWFCATIANIVIAMESN